MLKDMNFGITNPYTQFGRISNPTKRPSSFHSFIFSFFLLLFTSCTDRTLFHAYKPLPAEGWERRDTVCFDVPQTDEDTDGTLFIGLRTAAHVGIQNVVLAVEQRGEAGDILRQDTIHYPLNDAEGNALTGGVNHHQYETQQLPFHMKKGQSGSVRIHHLMSHEILSGITEVGIRINKAL